MKRLFLIAMLLGGVGIGNLVFGLNKAHAVPVKILIDDLYDWGRLYNYNAGTNTHESQNINPFDLSAGADITADLPGQADGNEDSWGTFKIIDIKEEGTANFLYRDALSPEELTAFFWGFDDDMITSPDALGTTTIGSVGIPTGSHLQIWTSPVKDYLTEVTYGTANSDTLTTYGGVNGIQDILDGAVLALDLVPHGVVDPDSGATFDMISDFNFTSFRGSGALLFDSQPGTLWHEYFDTNTKEDGSDFAMDFTAEPNGLPVGDWVVSGDGALTANVVPEPTTIALLGIGLVGMAGVAVRRKLVKKNS